MSRIIVVGWPRSGTTWLSRLIIHYHDGPSVKLWIEREQGLHPYSFRVHEIDRKKRKQYVADGGKIVFITRDPRDIAVSEYFFLHGRIYSVVDTTLLDYLKIVFATARGKREGWRDYTRKWLRLAAASDSIITASHEALWLDRKQELQRILYEAGIIPDARRIQHASDASRTFDGTRPAYTRTRNWRKENLPALSGLPGEWQKHFTPEAAIFLEEYCGDFMRKLGYGTEEAWTELLSR